MQAKIQALLEEDFYIAKSDYAGITEAYAEMIHFFEVMENSGMLPDFCVRNGMAEDAYLSNAMSSRNRKT